MRNRLAVLLLLAVGLVFGLLFARQLILSRGLPHPDVKENKLRVLTYSTFVGSNGPGLEIIRRFENEHDCKIELVTSTDAGLLLERLKLAQSSLPFDVVIGLDQLLLPKAKSDFKWQEIAEDRRRWAPEAAALSDHFFSAFDWSPLTFVYRKDDKPLPTTFNDLLDERFSKQWAIQDPHVSTPGLQFFEWVRVLQGDGTVPWLKQFKERVHSISPTWAFSYGLFKKGQVRFVFSYVTSLAYHWGEDHDRSFQVLSFPQGHPVQVELAGIPQSCANCAMAQAFVQTLHQDWAQTLIMKKNYMFPVVNGLTAGTIYAELPVLKTLSTLGDGNLNEWDQVFSR